jgi:hypothetical protein
VQASTQVSDDLFSYSWTSAELVAVSLAEAVAFALGLVGLAGLRASGVAGPARAARTGLGVALAGSVLFVVAELASIAVRDQAWTRARPAPWAASSGSQRSCSAPVWQPRALPPVAPGSGRAGGRPPCSSAAGRRGARPAAPTRSIALR